jgi:hypothetical protein
MSLRLAHVMASQSIATDLGMGQPLEFALSSCLAAVRLGERVGLSEDDLRKFANQEPATPRKGVAGSFFHALSRAPRK